MVVGEWMMQSETKTIIIDVMKNNKDRDTDKIIKYHLNVRRTLISVLLSNPPIDTKRTLKALRKAVGKDKLLFELDFYYHNEQEIISSIIDNFSAFEQAVTDKVYGYLESIDTHNILSYKQMGDNIHLLVTDSRNNPFMVDIHLYVENGFYVCKLSKSKDEPVTLFREELLELH